MLSKKMGTGALPSTLWAGLAPLWETIWWNSSIGRHMSQQGNLPPSINMGLRVSIKIVRGGKFACFKSPPNIQGNCCPEMEQPRRSLISGDIRRQNLHLNLQFKRTWKMLVKIWGENFLLTAAAFDVCVCASVSVSVSAHFK